MLCVFDLKHSILHIEHFRGVAESHISTWHISYPAFFFFFSVFWLGSVEMDIPWSSPWTPALEFGMGNLQYISFGVGAGNHGIIIVDKKEISIYVLGFLVEFTDIRNGRNWA